MGSCLSSRRTDIDNEEDRNFWENLRRNNAFIPNQEREQQQNLPEDVTPFFSFFARNSRNAQNNTRPNINTDPPYLYTNSGRGARILNPTNFMHLNNVPIILTTRGPFHSRGSRIGTNNNYHHPPSQSEEEEINVIRGQIQGMETLFTNLFQPSASSGNTNSNSGGGFPGFFRGSSRGEAAFPGFQGGVPPQEQPPIPPASKKALRQIPTISVTPEDLIDESNRECCICLEENKLGEKVARLPCGHLFHRPCISDWLIKHNTCPICRYELETDDPEFERGRKIRMSNRKQRFRPYELKRMGIRELKALASSLGLSNIQSVVEKGELVHSILNSGKIDVVASAEPVEYKLSELRSMGVGKLKKAMTEGGVFFDPVDVLEKEDMVQIFLNSGRLIALPEDDSKVEDHKVEYENSHDIYDVDHSHHSTSSMDLDTPDDTEMSVEEGKWESEHNVDIHDSGPSNTHTYPASITTASSHPNNRTSSYPTTPSSSQTSFSTHSISQLKSFARQLNINVNDCVEKREMVERIVNALERTGAPPRQRRRF